MYRIKIALLLLCLTTQLTLPCPAAAGPCGGYKLFPEHLARLVLTLDQPWLDARHGLGHVEAALFQGHLRAILDFMAAQACLQPPKGAEVRGRLGLAHSYYCQGDACPGLPLAGGGALYFHNLIGVGDEPPAPIVSSDIRMLFSINDIVPNFPPFAEGLRDLSGRSMIVQLPRVGDINGAPLYRHMGRQTDMLILSRNPRPWWQPVSREAFLRTIIRDLEKEVAAMGPPSSTPAGDLYRQWLAERPQREANFREAYAAMKEVSAEMAEQFREQSEKSEMEVTEKYRRDREREAAQTGKAAQNAAPAGMLQRLERHKAVLAAMAPELRAGQAVYKSNENPLEPDLAPPGSTEGGPLVVLDPAYFDPALPPTAVQLIAISFSPDWILPDWADSCAGRNPAIRLLHQLVHQTDWRQLHRLMGP